MTSPVCAVVPRERDRDADDGGQFGTAARYFSEVLNDTEFGLHFARIHSRLPVASVRTRTAQSVNVGLGPDGTPVLTGNYASNAGYFIEYPEDIDIFGVSFNTEIGVTGFALQGELSLRRNQPIQIDDEQLLLHGLSALANLPGVLGAGCHQAFVEPADRVNQLGRAQFSQEVAGYRRKDVLLQMQVAVSKVLGPRMGADQVLFLAEAGVTQVRDMEEKSELRYEGPGFADPTSWGYRLVVRGTYNNAIGALSLIPGVAFYHDVDRMAPLPIRNFIEDRKTVTLSIDAEYLSVWRGRLSYTNSFGAGRRADRDFLALSASYSF